MRASLVPAFVTVVCLNAPPASAQSQPAAGDESAEFAKVLLPHKK